MTEERRAHPRLKLRVPVELRTEGSDAPLRLETTDISFGGFYIEMMFTLQVGTKVEIRLQLGESTVMAVGNVATRDTSVGNGIQFTTMLPEHRERLKRFLIVAEVERKTSTDQ